MVILQFNKLIRNKWVWGVFAIAISFFFAFDFLVADLDRGDARDAGGGAGTLAGKSVKAVDFTTVADEIRGIGRNRDWRRKTSEVNRLAWETLAQISVAEANGMVATDADVRQQILNDRTFAPNGAFSFELYRRILAENGVSPEAYEAFLKRRLTAMRVSDAVLGSACWVSPMEFDRAVADVTDTFTVRVASFTQTKAERDAVKLDDAGLKKWYDANTNSLALPERIKLRMVAFDATDAKLLAKMVVTTNEMHDLYDTTVDKYTTTDTNGVEHVKTFDEVKGEIEKELRKIAAIQYFETNLNRRAYGVKAAKGASRLDEIAKEDGLKVTTSDWFSLEGGANEGFMVSPWEVAPGAKDFNEKVAELDSSSDDLRYGVITSDTTVWLVERVASDEVKKFGPAHTPDFAEAKNAIRRRARAAAQADAFKAKVEAIAAKGTNAVLAAKNVSTNITFAICDLSYGAFPNQNAVAGAARKLVPGGVSEFTPTGTGRGVLVVCVARKPGDASKAVLVGEQLRGELAVLQRREIPEAWMTWNLDRMGYEPNDLSSVTPEAEAEEE